MTTASTAAILSQSSNANFQAWYNEIITALVTSCGLTQTTDTGQIGATASIPAANASAGYVILKFNDTAQSTSAVFIKLEFGAGSLTNNPMMWITVGQGSNGSGTLTGTLSVRVAAFNSATPVSIVTSYPSRYCWNATAGILEMAFKIGGCAANCTFGGFFVGRDNDSSGVVTTNSVTLISSSTNATQISTSVGNVQAYNYASNTWVSIPTQTSWCFWPYALTTTTVSGQIQVAPAVLMTPILYISNALCVALALEIPVGNTVTMALVGSTSKTYLSVGNMWGGSSGGNGLFTGSTGTLLMLWQ